MNNYLTAMYQDDVTNLPIILNTISNGFNQNTLISENGRDFHQILFVVDGTGVVIYNGVSYELKKGTAFFTAKNVPITYKSNGNLITAFITVNGAMIDSLLKHFNIGGFLYKKYVNIEKYLTLLNDIISEYFTYKRNGIISSLSYNVFVNFFETPKSEVNEIKEISLYIEKNFTTKLTLDGIAKLFKISVSKLTHSFKKQFNYTVFEYVLNLRLNYAKNLLMQDSNLKIQDVAFSCGFDDVSYFCKAYKKKFNASPTYDRI